MPTAVARPCPSGPVVVSTPLGLEIFRMSRGFRAELAEIPDLVERHLCIAGEIQQRIEQHRAVTGRKNEAVAVRPSGLGGVEFQELREQHGGDVGGAHRQAGMAGFCLLDGIHRQRADRIGHTGMIDARHDENPPEMRCLVAIRRVANCLGTSLGAKPWETGSKALDSISVPGVQGSETRPGPKSCFAVHSLEAALRWPRLPRKFRRLNACRTADFAVRLAREGPC